MISKMINKKFFVIFILIISFVFLLGYNGVYARSISFDLKDGTISIIQDNLENEEEPDNGTNGNIEQDEEPEEPNEDEEIQEEGIVKEGAYIISCAGDNNFVFDVSGPSTDNTAKLNIWQRTEAPNQKFYITYEGDEYYKIASVNSAKILDVPNASKEEEEQLQQYENNDTEAQRFKIIENEDGTYSFIAECSGLAVDVQTGIYENGRKVQQYEVNGTTAQKFNLEKTELINDKVNNGIISIKTAKNPSMQIDMIDCSSEEGNKAHLWEQVATLAQRFEMHRVGENEIRIRTAASGGFLKGSNSEKGADVVQIGNSTTEASDSDTWRVEWDEGIILVNKETGLVLTVSGDINNTNGTEIKLMDRTDDDTQRLLINTEYLIPNGYYMIESKYGTILDAKDNLQGTHLQTWSRTETLRQGFYIEITENGYKIKSPVSGYIVDVYAGSMDNAAVVQMEIDAGTKSQRWTPELLDGGYITFRNVNSGLMLNVHMFNSEPGAEINQGLEDHSDAQKWKLVSTSMEGLTLNKDDFLPNGLYTIESKYGTMLDIKSNNQGTPMQTWTKTETSRQVFEFELMEDGYKIKSPVSGYVLDVQGGSMLNAATVQMEIDAGTKSQRWILEMQQNGYIGIKNVNSGMMLNVHFANKEPGAVVNQGIQDNGEPQQWKITSTKLDEFSNAWGDDWSTDKTYLAGVVDRANRVGSDTDWFVAIDVRNFRMTLLNRINQKWYVDACFNATMGYLGSNGMSHTGLSDYTGRYETNWVVEYKTPNRSGDLWFVCYIDVNNAPDQGWHNHYELAEQSYSSHGCPRLTDERAKYIYDRVTIGTRVHIWHEY